MNRHIKIVFIGILSIFICTSTKGQEILKLWNGTPPTSNEIKESEMYDKGEGWLTNISVPELLIYRPKNVNNTGTAVIICPGGGYAGLAIQHEGIQFAQWLTSKGIVGIVLKYRLPNQHKEIPLADAQQAIRYVRSHAAEFNIKSDKIGIAGFSAGGHLASTASTHFSNTTVSSRPNFSILFYPVITMDTLTHMGSRINLIGENPSDIDILNFSNEKQVNKDTPPAILLLSDDDKAVNPVNSTEYYKALVKNNIGAAMYVFPNGGHGWGMKNDFTYHNQMLTLLEMWLQNL